MHETFWRKKNEQVYIDEHKEFNNQPVLTGVHKEWRENEYEYFR